MYNNFSILVPVYNFDVLPLINQLKQLADRIGKSYEIIVIDDASLKEYKQKNKALRQIENLVYVELNENLGRSKIRNLLFDKAKYEACIVLDCDVLLAKETFLDQYLQHLNSENIVVGGHTYLQYPPKDKSKYFHWLYGNRVEVATLDNRQKNAYASFMTNSFAVSKSLFQCIKFEENITEYGHEDTLFGIQLKKEKIPIVHIANPVVHMGIETESIFYIKQEKAIKNLVQLCNNPSYKQDIGQHVKLVQFYQLFYHKQPYKFAILCLTKFVSLVEKIAKLNSIRLLKFNLWKLSKFDEYSKEL